HYRPRVPHPSTHARPTEALWCVADIPLVQTRASKKTHGRLALSQGRRLRSKAALHAETGGAVYELRHSVLLSLAFKKCSLRKISIALVPTQLLDSKTQAFKMGHFMKFGYARGGWHHATRSRWR